MQMLPKLQSSSNYELGTEISKQIYFGNQAFLFHFSEDICFAMTEIGISQPVTDCQYTDEGSGYITILISTNWKVTYIKSSGLPGYSSTW